MAIRRISSYLFLALLFLLLAGVPIKSQLFVQNGSLLGLIAGRNVNMVSGTKLPLGDPWLQRQNEPSGAVSSRNPMHLFFAANDYRTIDMPDNYNPRGIPGVSAARDSWIGVFESFDGGESSVTMLLPGFPQDTSNEALASPIYGFDTACDPIVRAGARGLFYLSGIAFNRSQQAGAVFVARYVDLNNREKVEEEIDPVSGYKKYVGPINYIDTRLVDAGNPGQFIDMPNMAVDVPRGGTAYGNVYLAYTVFLGNSDINVRSRVVFVRSIDGGLTWSKQIKLTESQHIIQRPMIVIDPSDPTGKTIYVSFRRFSFGNTPGGIVIVKSIDGGLSFSKPADVATLLYPFDQLTKGTSTITSFRTNSYPTMAVDGSGVAYIAWAQRYEGAVPGPNGQARIVISYSQNGGLTWSSPQFVDPYYAGDGHQFMPSMTSAGGKVTVIWYDQRDDIALHHPNTNFIEDVKPEHRHTIDVRAAEAPAAAPPIFGPSILVSRYLFYMLLDENGEPYKEGEYPKLWQGEFSYACLPLFWLGTKPFHGDYIEVLPSPQILPPPANMQNSWIFNTSPSEPTSSHGVWTDNRNVWPPAGNLWGDWVNYNPPTSEQDGDFGQQNPCNNKNTTGMRNQNIYTANLNHGVIVGSPGNTKQLDIQRSFVVFVKDTIGVIDEAHPQNRLFHLRLDGTGSSIASFEQFDDTVRYLDITVPPYSSASSTVYVNEAGGQFAPVRVNVYENESLVGYVILNPDSTNNPVLDPDGNNWEKERHNPIMGNPKIWKYDVGNQKEPNAKFLSPRGQNPRGQNSGYLNPRGQNPRGQNYAYVNPRGQNPDAPNPRGQNESIVNSEMYNPRGQNFSVANTALTDMSWTVTNDGNTTSAYSFNIASENADSINGILDDGWLIAQVLVYKVHATPIDSECELLQTHADELLVNVTNPRGQNPRVEDSGSGDFTTLGMRATRQQDDDTQDITFYLAPGEEAEVTLRVYDPDTTDNIDIDTVIVDQVGGETAAQAANTGDPAPIIVTQPDPPYDPASQLPAIGVSHASLSFEAMLGANPPAQPIIVWNSGSGTLNYTISDDAGWLSVSPSSGTSDDQYDENPHTVSVNIAGLTPGTYPGTITISDPYATNNPARVPVTLTIYTTPPSGEWVRRYDGPIHADDSGVAVATDSGGNVYATGASTGAGTGQDILTIKYNAVGSVVWTARYDAGHSGNNNETPTAIAVDSAGNVYITGTQQDGAYSNLDWITIKYNNLGVQQWAVDYDRNAVADDIPRAITIDPTGNVYVTGESVEAPSVVPDFVTIKYGPSGSQIWASSYVGFGGSDMAKALALDSSGNVYVGGTSSGIYGNFDYALVKYDNSGVEQWVRRYDGTASGNDEVSAVAVDSSGNVYVSGSSEGDSGSFDYCTIKFDGLGEVGWIRRYDRVGGHDLANAMAVDSSGNVYVTGRSDYGLGEDPLSDYATVKYDSAGTQQWVALYDGPDRVQDVARGIVVDPAGNVYVAGESDGVGTSFDYATIRYDGNGNEIWVRRYNGPGNFNDSAAAVVIDPAGNVLITGTSTGSGTGLDFATIKYRPTLEEWVARYNGPGNGSDEAMAITTDSSGNVYVAGGSTGSGTDKDFAIKKYNSSGVEQWVARYNGPGNGSDGVEAIAVDPSGNVYVTGGSTSGTGFDYATIKYNGSGAEQWVARYDGPGHGSDIAGSIAVDPSGNVYVTGGSTGSTTGLDYATIKYNSSGVEQWVARYDGPGNGDDGTRGMAMDSSGNIYVTGYSRGSGTDYDYATIKYDSLGVRQWEARYNGPGSIADTPFDIAVDSSGNAYVTGVSPGSGGASYDYATIKYDSSGVEQWIARYNAPGNGGDIAHAIAMDSSGNIYVTGESYVSETSSDYATIKYNGSGVEQWVSRYNGPVNGWDMGIDIAVDSSGNIYVTGVSSGSGTDNDFVTIKYNSSGVEQWVARYNGPGNGGDVTHHISVDSSGNIYITGRSTGSGTGLDWATIKYRKT